MRRALVGLGLAVSAIASRPAAAQPEAIPPPPPASVVCPAIEEDGMLCAADPMSGNCADFVAAADRLAGLYRAKLTELPPGSEAALLTTSWWGCGPPTLYDVKKLLVRIDTPPVLALLAAAPYRNLPEVPAPPSGSPAPPTQAPQCSDLPTPLERSACIGVELQAARAAERSAFERCKGLVIADLRDDLLAAEKSFQATLAGRCDAQAADEDDAATQAFTRSQCLIDALSERTPAIGAAHPECATPD